jgi:IMP dehydrogenase
MRTVSEPEESASGTSKQDIRLALTYDDVLLQPRYSEIRSRRDVDTGAQFTRRIHLGVPIVSANMDTVTESEMAIAMARHGGIGVIHRFNSVEEQVEEVRRVKRSESFVIERPYTVTPNESVDQARDLMEEHSITGLPVVSDGKLAGMLSRRDIVFAASSAKGLVRDFMTPREKLLTGAIGITLEDAERALSARKVEKLPLVDSDGQLCGLITVKDIQKRKQFPHSSKDTKGRLLVAAAVGVTGDYLNRAAALLRADVDALVLDIAHGHSLNAIQTLRSIKDSFKESEVIAGNVATVEGTIDLIEAGADGIKVGVGPGSICITRIVTGVGVPQLAAVMDCARAARERGVPIVADGGIRTSGDIVKAVAAGANTVMLGNLLAGTKESPGITVVRNGRRYKVSRGMASVGATIERRRREKPGWEGEQAFEDVVPEGVEGMVPYKGDVSDVLVQLVGGLRSGMSYIGARTTTELYDLSRFVRITSASMKESGPHDVEL